MMSAKPFTPSVAERPEGAERSRGASCCRALGPSPSAPLRGAYARAVALGLFEHLRESPHRFPQEIPFNDERGNILRLRRTQRIADDSSGNSSRHATLHAPCDPIVRVVVVWFRLRLWIGTCLGWL